MLGVLADNHDVTLALDDLALLAHGLYGRSHFHVVSLLTSIQRFPFRQTSQLFERHVMRPRVRSYGESSIFTLSPG